MMPRESLGRDITPGRVATLAAWCSATVGHSGRGEPKLRHREGEIPGSPYWLVAQNVFLLREMFEDPCAGLCAALEATGAWFCRRSPFPHATITAA